MRKENRTYYFSVEGATEKWYLDWLQNMINADPDAKYTVKLNSKIQKDPLAHVKKMTITGKTEVTHIFDYESEEAVHVQQFKTALDRMKEAQNSGDTNTTGKIRLFPFGKSLKKSYLIVKFYDKIGIWDGSNNYRIYSS